MIYRVTLTGQCKVSRNLNYEMLLKTKFPWIQNSFLGHSVSQFIILYKFGTKSLKKPKNKFV